MDTRYVIDSSVFVALYYEGDENHAYALEIIKTLQGKNMVVHPYVISEVATVLTYKISKKTADDFVSNVTEVDDIQIPQVDVSRDIEFFKSTNKKMSYTDIVLVQLAKDLNANLITFDKQMISLFKK